MVALLRVTDMNEDYWPPFLDLLDSDPDRAFAEFYRFAVALLRKKPPRLLAGLSKEDREDFIHDFIYHCVKDGFQVLRQYRPMGRPFAVWLYAIACNKCVDFVRSKGRSPRQVSIHEDADGKGLENLLADPQEGPEGKLEKSELVDIVSKGISMVGEYCQLLLNMAADGLKPKEMARLLGLSEDQNKKVSDDLRYCKEKMMKQK